jgi:hypothetical protein
LVPPVFLWARLRVLQAASSGLRQVRCERKESINHPRQAAPAEQGQKKPAGAARKLLDLMERKGIEVLI